MITEYRKTEGEKMSLTKENGGYVAPTGTD